MLRNILKPLLGIPIGISIVDYVGYVARVDGPSMRPTLNEDPTTAEYVFLNKLSAKNYSVEKGEIVCCISPKDPKQKIIKRVIGNQGDVVETKGYKEKFVKVPAGHIWIEGDYADNSLDSNTFGPIPAGLLIAKASVVVWPASKWRVLDTELKERVIKKENKAC